LFLFQCLFLLLQAAEGEPEPEQISSPVKRNGQDSQSEQESDEGSLTSSQRRRLSRANTQPTLNFKMDPEIGGSNVQRMTKAVNNSIVRDSRSSSVVSNSASFPVVAEPKVTTRSRSRTGLLQYI
jgi:hypothetical protein